MFTPPQLKDGERLAIPPQCPPHVYDLLLQCWTRTAESRRSVEGVSEELSVMLKDDSLQSQVSVEAVFSRMSSVSAESPVGPKV